MALQIPKTRLVACRRMVRTAGELEGKYGGHGGRHGGDLRYGVEYQCQPRGQVQDAGAGQILSKSVVSELAPGLRRDHLLMLSVQLEQADYRA